MKSSAIKALQLMLDELGADHSDVLDALPSLPAIQDFYKLRGQYSARDWLEVLSKVESGDDPGPLLRFVMSYILPKKLDAEIMAALRAGSIRRNAEAKNAT